MKEIQSCVFINNLYTFVIWAQNREQTVLWTAMHKAWTIYNVECDSDVA